MALGVNIVSEFDSKGIRKALTEFKKLEGAGAKSTYALRTFDSALGSGMANLAKFGGIAAAAIGGLGAYMVKGAEFAKQADDRLVSVANSMKLFGDNADVVAQRLQRLGDAQEYELGVTAETIKMTQAKLLTFANIGKTANEVGGAFDRATVAAIDLAAAGFGAAETNAVQLGKALQDPVKGITALARSGVTFTDAEKAKIKALVESGKLLEAQDTLLKAIETQVGGTAAATTTDTFRIAAAFGHVRDEIGTALLPVVEKLADFMVQKVVPFATEAGRVFGEEGFAGGIGFLVGKIDEFITGGGKVVNIITAITTAMVALKLVTIAATISQNLFNTALLSNPIGIVVAAIIAVGVALVAAYVRFEGFRKVVQAVANAAITAWEWMTNMMIKGINLVIGAINFFQPLLSRVGLNFDKLGEIGEVSFGRINIAAGKTVKRVQNVTQAIADARNEERKLAEESSGGGAGGGDDDGVGGGVTKTVKKAKEKLKEYTDALKDTMNAERSLVRSGKDVAAARVDLSKATKRVEDAEKRLADLRSRTADPNEIASAERKLERSKYAAEEAVFSVADAEAELAKVRLDPKSSAVDIRRAEIALAEAKLSVTDATMSQQDAERELEAVRTMADTVDEIAEAERELADAKDAERDASEKVTDQIWREWEATQALLDAKQKLAGIGSEVGGRIVSRATTRFQASLPPAMAAAGGIAPVATAAAPSGVSIVNNITAGMGADSKEIAQVIVDSLRDYERSNGFIPVTAQYAIAL